MATEIKKNDTTREKLIILLAKYIKECSKKLNEKRIGEVCEMLVENIEEGYLIGRTYAEAPDVDGRVVVPLRGRYDIDEGDYIKIKITAVDEYDLEGEIYEFAE